MADKTTIVIAHRLSTLKDMDRIIVFVNGKIVEDGTVEQLLKNGSKERLLRVGLRVRRQAKLKAKLKAKLRELPTEREQLLVDY